MLYIQYSRPIIYQSPKALVAPCTYCGELKVHVVVTQGKAKVYWLPLFPTTMEPGWVCTGCERYQFTMGDKDPFWHQTQEGLVHAHTPWKEYWGGPVLVALAITVVLYFGAQPTP